MIKKISLTVVIAFVLALSLATTMLACEPGAEGPIGPCCPPRARNMPFTQIVECPAFDFVGGALVEDITE